MSNGAPTAPLQDFTTSTAHFTATQAGTYVFELAVSDNLNNSATAQVTAQVDQVPVPPTPAATPIVILFPPVVNLVEGNQVTYDTVINNLPAGALVTWTEVLGKADPAPTPDPGDPSIVELTMPAVDADTPFQRRRRRPGARRSDQPHHDHPGPRDFRIGASYRKRWQDPGKRHRSSKCVWCPGRVWRRSVPVGAEVRLGWP